MGLRFRTFILRCSQPLPMTMQQTKIIKNLSKPVREALKGIAPVRTVPLPFSPISAAQEKKFAKLFQGAAGMLLRPGYITPSLLDQLPDLKVVAVHGAGVDQVDVDACTERGVLVTNAPGGRAPRDDRP